MVSVHYSLSVNQQVKRIIMHPGYSYFTSARDVALLELEEDIKFNDKTSPVCLPLQPLRRRETCVFAGWGKTMGESGTTCPSSRLVMVTLEINC